MERDYYYPNLANRETPEVWTEGGATDMRQRAQEKARSILASHYPDYIQERADTKIRDRFDILLPRECMRATEPLAG